MDMPSEATRRLSEDHVAWLTTVTDSGAPAPNPVWFVVELDHHSPPSASGAFVAKYANAVRDELQTTMEEIDKTYNTRIRIRPTRVRLTPT